MVVLNEDHSEDFETELTVESGPSGWKSKARPVDQNLLIKDRETTLKYVLDYAWLQHGPLSLLTPVLD